MSNALPFKVVIPARYEASRLPGKPLRRLAGEPLIVHVHRRAVESGAGEVIIATDDRRIQEEAMAFGARVMMTAATHACGTDRIAEVAAQVGWAADTIVVNVQGDEPLVPPALIRQTAAGLAVHDDAPVATLCTRIDTADELFSPDVVKVVRDAAGYALYFSRAAVPYDRERFQAAVPVLGPDVPYWRHLGMYAYRAAFLRRYAGMSSAPLERSERLEQLRILWHGERIYVDEASEMAPPGIDTEADLRRVERLLAGAAR